MLNWPVVITAALVWALTLGYVRSRRRWLLYYLGGAFGLVLLTVAVSYLTNLDQVLASLEAAQTARIAHALNIAVEQQHGSGLAIRNHIGWAVFDVGIECSALLEMAAVVGLLVFYPAFRPGRRAGSALVGLAVTYAANIARILLIVAIISNLGTPWVFAAHAVFGRVLFFGTTIALYWFIVTRPSVRTLGARLASRAAPPGGDERA